MMNLKKLHSITISALCTFAAMLISMPAAFAQGSHPIDRASVSGGNFQSNIDESKVRPYTLPELLITSKGKSIKTARQWEKKRRDEVLKIVADNQFGHIPTAEVETEYRVIESCDTAMNGRATRKQVELTFRRNGVERKSLLLMYIPNSRKGNAPCFMQYNYQGNHSTTTDPAVLPSEFSPFSRASQLSRWPYEIMIDAGYAVATAHYYDFFPDNYECYEESILPLFGYNRLEDIPDNGPRAISCWAWGYMRIMDYLQTDKDLDPAKVILAGHSRLGKTALWTAANDRRFGMVVSSCAGCGGDAIYRRNFGEEIGIITHTFPHWFCGNFISYGNNADALPHDSHFLLALVAPTPLYIVSAQEDTWADPKGQMLGACGATPVYNLYGHEGLSLQDLPPLNQPIMNRIGFHYRTGVHDVTPYDWKAEIDFANKWFYGK